MAQADALRQYALLHACARLGSIYYKPSPQVMIAEIAKRNPVLLNGEYYPIVFPNWVLSSYFMHPPPEYKYVNWFMQFYKKEDYATSPEDAKTWVRKIFDFLNPFDDEIEEDTSDNEAVLEAIDVQTALNLRKFLDYFKLSGIYTFSYINKESAIAQVNTAIVKEAEQKINYELFLQEYYEKKRM